MTRIVELYEKYSLLKKIFSKAKKKNKYLEQINKKFQWQHNESKEEFQQQHDKLENKFNKLLDKYNSLNNKYSYYQLEKSGLLREIENLKRENFILLRKNFDSNNSGVFEEKYDWEDNDYEEDTMYHHHNGSHSYSSNDRKPKDKIQSLYDETGLPLKRAYKKLAKKYHPDNPNTGNKELFIKIKEYYINNK